MPGMDGLQLVGEIKQRSSDLPVMMVTAYGDEERLRQAAEYGAAEFLTKPVDCERLSARLRQLPSARDEETGVDRMTAYSLPLSILGPGQRSPSGQVPALLPMEPNGRCGIGLRRFGRGPLNVASWHLRNLTPAATRAAAIKGGADIPARSPFMLRPGCRTLRALSCNDPR